MKRLGRRQALMGLGVMLAGCTPEQKAVTQSNAAAVSGQKLTRVLIGIWTGVALLTEAQNASLLQPDELKRAFDAKWPPLGIAVEVVDANGAPESGGPALTAANARFRSTQFLFLQTGRYHTRGLFIRDYEIDARIYEGASRKLIWRATTELPDFWRASHTPVDRPVAADRYVDSLTAKLREDGLI